MRIKLFLILTISLCAITINAQSGGITVPTEVKPFIEKGSKAIALESADLNGDKNKDYILVLEREMSEDEKGNLPKNQRPLLILISDKNNKLTEAKRNESIVLCSQCGGIFGDPFNGVEIGKKTFTVSHYGGSAWRWSNSYKFNYSRIDKTWQLVKVEKSSYHNVRPMKETLEETVMTPPKDFGKVDFADFKAEDFEEYNTKNLIKFENGAYTAKAKGVFNKTGDDFTFNVKAKKGQRMIVNIVPITKGLATAATVTSPNGEGDGQIGGFIMNSVLKESGYYKIRVTQRPTEHKFPAEFAVEVVLLSRYANEESDTRVKKGDGDVKTMEVPKIEANPNDVSTIDGIIKALYGSISGDVGKEREWARDRTLYTPDIRFTTINSSKDRSNINRITHQQYVNSNNEFFVKSGFVEREINRVTRRFGNIAQVFSTYEWETADKKLKGRGVNSIGLFYDGKRWWISALSWENEHNDNPIPNEFLPIQ